METPPRQVRWWWDFQRAVMWTAVTTVSALLALAAAALAVPCGDGIVDSGEQCDDGNTANGDGCSGGCQIEPCWTCNGQPSVCTLAATTITSIDTAGDVGLFTSIRLGTDDLAVVSYYDAQNLALKVAHCNDALCTSAVASTVDSAGGVGQYSSLAIGSDGLPIISYPTYIDLKVAHCNDAACNTPATITTVVSHRLTALVSAGQTSLIIGADGLPLIGYPFQYGLF